MERLIDLYPDWLVDGFFSKIPSPPWDSSINTELDMQYFGNKSGTKVASPLVVQLCGGGTVTPAIAGKLASLAFSLYGKNWTALYKTMLLEYSPIENYDMEETEEVTDSGTTTGTIKSEMTDGTTAKKTGTDTVTDGGTVEREDTGTVGTKVEKDETTTTQGTVSKQGQDTTGVFGFNSNTAVNSDTTNSTGTDESTETAKTTGGDTTTETRNLSNTETRNLSTTTEYGTTDTVETEGSKTDTTNMSNNKTINRTLRRHGNIGVTTSQQMIESERQLWYWSFFDTVFSDLDKLLTSPIFVLEV